MAEYDGIADHYRDRTINLYNQHVRQYTYRTLLGDYSGLDVLDLACGDGVTSRWFKPGAARVVGVDISERLIDYARAEEAARPLGIEYIAADVATLGKIGEFDRVVATQLLHYAASEAALAAMARTVYDNLKPGGRFVTVNGNFDLTGEQYARSAKYGVPAVESGETPREGEALKVIFTTKEGRQAEFFVYCFSSATYRRILEGIGFESVVWHRPQVAPEAVAELGEAFWQDALDYPMDWFIECRK